MTSSPNGERPALPLLGLLKTVRSAETPAWIGPSSRAHAQVAPRPVEPEPSAERESRPPTGPSEAELQARRERELAEARSKAEQQARAQVRAEHEQLKAQYVAAIRGLTEAAQEIRETCSAKTVELALVIARDVLGRELSVDRAALSSRVAEAMSAIGGEPSVRVRVGTADAAFLVAHPDVLKAGVELVEDPTLAPGACFVESSRRVIDASLEVRLSVVRDVLAEIASHPDHDEEHDEGASHAH